MAPTVSWLMPVYNCELSLKSALESMLEQSYTDFEIVLVIEKDTNTETTKICENFYKNNSNVKLIYNKEKLGIAKSLNVGIMHCSGQYIARMDADDYSLPDRLKIQVEFFNENPNVFLVAGNVNVINKSINNKVVRYKNTISSEEIRVKLLFESCFTHPAIMMRNTKTLYYPERIAEDYGLFSELISKEKMAIIEDIVLEFQESPYSASKRNYFKVRKDSERISREVIYRELNVDTRDIEGTFFGWRSSDNWPQNPEEFLKQAYELYSRIIYANNRLHVFNEGVLLKQITQEWHKTLGFIHPYFFPKLYVQFDKIDQKIIDDCFQSITNLQDDTKNIFFGTGYLCKRWMENASEEEKKSIICFSDSDSSKWGNELYGKKIISPQEIFYTQYDKVVITALSAQEQIRDTLIKIGVNENNIYNLKGPQINFRFGQEYKRKMKQFPKEQSKKARMFLFCACDYGNLGDHAIAEAIHIFVSMNTDIELYEIPFCTERNYNSIIDSIITKQDIIAIVGGGFFGSIWYGGQLRTNQILQRYPENRIIIFPQTMFWEKGWETLRIESKNIFNNHIGKVFICARDEISYQEMKELFNECEVIHAPDMVLSIDWSKYVSVQKRTNIGICLKNDAESILSDEKRDEIFNIGTIFNEKVVSIDNELNRLIFEGERSDYLHKLLNQYASKRLVITDRMHGMLFSYITKTPCIVMAGVTHKNIENYKWIEKAEYIKVLSDFGELQDLASILMCYKDYNYVHMDTTHCFDELKRYLSEIVGRI